ncbi:hypothetical protein [Aestuariivita sp.]|jgi:hypothetical protein|uniref:hypothetical protein n=1 Tax=Aestuariivita sp. TaxID=1872407 RepID=UPI0025BA6FC9|nr:hypothetical protein [Aestuariivita sp.]
MPDLIKLYIRHSLIGFAIAGVFVAALLYLNVMNLWTLVSNDQSAILVVFILWFFNGVVFASVQFAYAVMNLAEKPDRSGGKGVTPFVLAPQKALVHAPRRPSGLKR